MRAVKTSIEAVRRRDLIEAAYQTFLEHGLGGMTMARIGERAGMSHGIVNYYFKSKDELLSAVVRKANCLIMREVARRLRQQSSPRARVSAVIAGNFPDHLFTRDIARAWASFYAAVGQKPEFGRLQRVVYRRLHTNLKHALVQLTSAAAAERIAYGIGVWIDGLWLRKANDIEDIDGPAAIRVIEEYVDIELRFGLGDGRDRLAHRPS